MPAKVRSASRSGTGRCRPVIGVNFGPSIWGRRPRRDARQFEPKTGAVSSAELLACPHVAFVQLHGRDTERGGQFFELHDVQATLGALDFPNE